MDPRIGELSPLYGPRPVMKRRDRRQSGEGQRSFEEALSEEDEERAGAEPAGEGPAARRLRRRKLQDEDRIVRRQDDDGIQHVDVLA